MVTQSGFRRPPEMTLNWPRPFGEERRLALTFYYGAGSPYAWRVWFALEHKAIPYDRKVLSFADGDLKKPEFVAVNPRGKVPAIVDGDMHLYESAAIVEYLEDVHPDSGNRLFPGAVRDRALVRDPLVLEREPDAPSVGRTRAVVERECQTPSSAERARPV